MLKNLDNSNCILDIFNDTCNSLFCNFDVLNKNKIAFPLNLAALDRWCLAYLWDRDQIFWANWPKELKGQLKNPKTALGTIQGDYFWSHTSQQVRFAIKYAEQRRASLTELESNDCKRIWDSWIKLQHLFFHETSPFLYKSKSGAAVAKSRLRIEKNLLKLIRLAVIDESSIRKQPESAVNKLKFILNSREAALSEDFNQSLRQMLCELVLKIPSKVAQNSESRFMLANKLVAMVYDTASINYPEHDVLPQLILIFSLSNKLFTNLRMRSVPDTQSTDSEAGLSLADIFSVQQRDSSNGELLSLNCDNHESISEKTVLALADFAELSLKQAKMVLKVTEPQPISYFYHQTAIYPIEHRAPSKDWITTLFLSMEKSRYNMQQNPFEYDRCLKSCDATGSKFPYGFKLARWNVDSKRSTLEQALTNHISYFDMDHKLLENMAKEHLINRGVLPQYFSGDSSTVLVGKLRSELYALLPNPATYFLLTESLENYAKLYSDTLINPASNFDTICLMSGHSTGRELGQTSYRHPESSPIYSLNQLLTEKYDSQLPKSFFLLLRWLLAIEYCLVASYYEKQTVGDKCVSIDSQVTGLDNGQPASVWWDAALKMLHSTKTENQNRPYLADLIREILSCAVLRIPLADSLPMLYHQHKRLYLLIFSFVDNYVLDAIEGDKKSLVNLLKKHSVDFKYLPAACSHLCQLSCIFNLPQLWDDCQLHIILNQINFVSPSTSAGSEDTSEKETIAKSMSATKTSSPDTYLNDFSAKTADRNLVGGCSSTESASVAAFSTRVYESLAPSKYNSASCASWKSTVNYASFTPLFLPIVSLNNLAPIFKISKTNESSILSFLHASLCASALSKVPVDNSMFSLGTSLQLKKNEETVGGRAKGQSSILNFFRPKTPTEIRSTAAPQSQRNYPVHAFSGPESRFNDQYLAQLAEASLRARALNSESTNFILALFPQLINSRALTSANLNLSASQPNPLFQSSIIQADPTLASSTDLIDEELDDYYGDLTFPRNDARRE